MAPSKTVILRGIALLAVVANAAFNYASERINSSLPSIAEVSAKYHAPFTPAPYAFSIWGLIYLGLTAYAIFTLRASQRTVKAHDSLAKCLVAYSLLGVG